MKTKLLSVLLLLIVAIGFSGVASAATVSKLVSNSYDEQVLVTPAYDEQVLVNDSYDEQVLVSDAYDETVFDYYNVSGQYVSAVTVHHDAVYQTVHHDAVYQTVHHDAVYINKTVVDQAAVAAYDEQVLVSDAYDEKVTGNGNHDHFYLQCNSAAMYNGYYGTPGFNQWIYASDYNVGDVVHGYVVAKDCCGKYFTTGTVKIHHDAVYKTVHHDAVPEVTHQEQVLVSPAYDEQVLVSDAYDEEVLVTDAYDEIVKTNVDYSGLIFETFDVSGWAKWIYSQPNSVGGWGSWESVYKTVHHDAVYETVHHDAVYETVHHDAVYKTVHHDAVYVTEVVDDNVVEPVKEVVDEVSDASIPMQETGGSFAGLIVGGLAILAGLGIYVRRRE